MPFERKEAATVKYRVARRYCLRAQASIPKVCEDQSETQEALGFGEEICTPAYERKVKMGSAYGAKYNVTGLAGRRERSAASNAKYGE